MAFMLLGCLNVTDKVAEQRPGCAIERDGSLLRATIGPGLADEVQRCYRAVAMECLRGPCHRILILGAAKFDAMAHLAGRDATRSLALAGMPADFRIALVALTDNLIGVYDDAVLEADRLGIEARRFANEAEAERWLKA